MYKFFLFIKITPSYFRCIFLYQLSITTLCGSVKTDKNIIVRKKGEMENSKYENANNKSKTPTTLIKVKGRSSLMKCMK